MQFAQPSLRDVCRAEASKRFGRYKQEDHAIVRPAQLSGDGLEQLRRKRELLRSMTPEQALQVIEIHQGLNLFEALVLARKEGKILVPNYVIDRILTRTGVDDFKRIMSRPRGTISGWTGTAIIYEHPGKSFGECVAYKRNDPDVQYSVYVTIPQRFRGKKGCALVVEHPDFDVVGLGSNSYELKADERSFHLLERFPATRGLVHRYNRTYRIPVGPDTFEVGETRTRVLWRADNYVGAVARNPFVSVTTGVYAECCWKAGFGAALF